MLIKDQAGINEAGQVVSIYLNQTLNNTKYDLTETQLNVTIAANADMKEASDVTVNIKSCDGLLGFVLGLKVIFHHSSKLSSILSLFLKITYFQLFVMFSHAYI